MLAMRAIAALAVGAAMMFESWAFVMPHQDPTDTLILVNKTNRAPAVPVTLVKPNVTPTREALSENIYMRWRRCLKARRRTASRCLRPAAFAAIPRRKRFLSASWRR